MSCSVATHETYNKTLLGATPYISEKINDYSVQIPVWLVDMYEVTSWDSPGRTKSILDFRGVVPQIEMDFDKWAKSSEATGCAPCLENCSYNWTSFGGYNLSRRTVALESREFETDEICLKEIASSYEFEVVMDKYIENIWKQSNHFKAYNVGLNALMQMAVKLVVDGSGIKGNNENPFRFPNLGTAKISMLNRSVLNRIYSQIRLLPEMKAVDVQDGRPLYIMSASDELIYDMFESDPNALQDLRAAATSDTAIGEALISKYNFVKVIMGQFINAPIDTPYRANVVNGEVVYVNPYITLPEGVVRGGAFSTLNPDYFDAEYEVVLIYGLRPFHVETNALPTTVGGGTEFGEQPSFLDSWQWFNLPTESDRFRRTGRFISAADIAIIPDSPGGVYALLVPRKDPALLATYQKVSECPPTGTNCSTNNIPAQGCPCPIIVGSPAVNPMNGNQIVQFSIPVEGEEGNTLNLGIDTGGFVSGTIVEVSADGFYVEVAGLPELTNCVQYTTVWCTNTLKCSSMVIESSQDASGVITAVLANNIVTTTPGQDVVAYMGDCTTQVLDLVSFDHTTNTYKFTYAAGSGPSTPNRGVVTGVTVTGDAPVDSVSVTTGSIPNKDWACDRGGIVKVCVPPTTIATCPACEGVTISFCGE